jgi:hypothetical protein
MKELKSYRNPFDLIDNKKCETCSTQNQVGFPLFEVHIRDEDRQIWMCDNCFDKAMRDAETLENRDSFENPDA